MKFPFVFRSTHEKVKRERDTAVKLAVELRQELFISRKNDLPHDPATGRFYNPNKETL